MKSCLVVFILTLVSTRTKESRGREGDRQCLTILICADIVRVVEQRRLKVR